jgi:hypothetical protein
VFGVVPVVLATPTLLKGTTRRPAARASMRAEMLEEDQRDLPLADFPVGILDLVFGLHTLAGGVRVSGVRHGCSL